MPKQLSPRTSVRRRTNVRGLSHFPCWSAVGQFQDTDVLDVRPTSACYQGNKALRWFPRCILLKVMKKSKNLLKNLKVWEINTFAEQSLDLFFISLDVQ